MPAKNLFALYKGYKLYCPLGHDLLRVHDGRYAVYVVMSPPWSTTVERYVVPQCFAATLREAEQLSIMHARRMVDERKPLEAMGSAAAARGKDEHAA